MKDLKVNDLPYHKPIILDEVDTIEQAAKAMENNKAGSVLIANSSGKLQGILTDRDLALALAFKKALPEDKIESILNYFFVSVYEDADLSELIDIMREYSVRRVPIVSSHLDDFQKCIGLISLDDLIRAQLIKIEEEAEIIKNQLHMPKEKQQEASIKKLFHQQNSKMENYHDFIAKLEKALEMPSVQVKSFTLHVLGVLLRRVPYESGKKFLSQLPYELQLKLLNDISEVDRSMTSDNLVEMLAKEYNLDRLVVREKLAIFWNILKMQTTTGNMKQLFSNLPNKMRDLFEQNLH